MLLFVLTGAQQAACCRLGGGGRRQALAAGGRGGRQERGEVEARALADGAEDGRRRVRWHGERVVGEADGRAQVALVGRDTGVDGRRDERAGLGWRDEEGLGPRAPLGLFAVVVPVAVLLERKGRQGVKS